MHSVAAVSELKFPRDGSVIECNVHQPGLGQHNVTMNQERHGPVDSQQLQCSPFSRFSISPIQLDKPIMVWTGISQPTGVTVNSKGEVIL